MEREDAYQLVLYLVIWVLLIADFGLGLGRGITYIFITLVLFFQTLGKREIDWVMWSKIYGALIFIWLVRRFIFKKPPSGDLGLRYIFY